MVLFMIDQIRDELHKAIDNADNATILKLSRKLDRIIVDFMLKLKSDDLSKHSYKKI